MWIWDERYGFTGELSGSASASTQRSMQFSSNCGGAKTHIIASSWCRMSGQTIGRPSIPCRRLRRCATHALSDAARGLMVGSSKW